MKERGLSKDSTIYHYTLLTKISFFPARLIIYYLILFFWLVLLITVFHSSQLWIIPVGFVVWHFFYYLLTRLLHRLTPFTLPEQWQFQWRSPLQGYLPSGYIAIRKLVSLHDHLLLTGLAASALFFIWMPPDVFFTFVFMHIWLNIPRVWLFRSLYRKNPNGYARFNTSDLALYRT